MFLLKFFGSKKLIAILAGVVAVIVTPILNEKLGVMMDPAEIAATIGSISFLVLSYVAAQWHIDIKTEGSTTAANVLNQVASSHAPGPMPPKVAAALTVALMFLPEGEAKEKVKAALDELTP